MPTKYRNPGPIKFRATIEPGDGGGAFVTFPHNVEELFGVKGRVPIKATFDGIAYRGSMVKMGTDCHLLLVLKEIREQIGKQHGDKVNVVVELDDEERKIELGADAQKALNADKKASSFWSTLSYTAQREYAMWIDSAKKPETRERRIGEMVKMLVAGKKR